jgi:hypothetical protein
MLAPSGLTAGDEYTPFPVANAHLCTPVAAFSAYTFLSYEPTKMLAPSGLTAGDDRTPFPVANAHLCTPVAAFSAYTLLSYEPTKIAR